MKMRKKTTIVSCAALVLCIAFSGCGAGGGEKDKGDIQEIEPVPIGSESGTETNVQEDSGAEAPEDGSQGEKMPSASGPEASTNAPGESEAPGNPEAGEVQALAVSCEIVREARTDEAGEEMVFSEYPVFTVTGTGYEGLSAALAAVNEAYRSENTVLLDELERDLKDYRESIDPAGVFGQGTSANITRCDTEVVSIMVIRTVNMGGPHPNNYWDYYNLNAGTGKELQLSDFITMDDAMIQTMIGRLHENFPEVEFDDEVLKREIPEIFAANNIGWYFFEGQINLNFPEGSFGFGHAVGSLGVTISLDEEHQ